MLQPELRTEEAGTREIVRPNVEDGVSVDLLAELLTCPFRALAIYQLQLYDRQRRTDTAVLFGIG